MCGSYRLSVRDYGVVKIILSTLVLFNKPFDVLCQFTDNNRRSTLADYIDIQQVYAAGRLDKDSEGLLLLTDDGALQHRITHPKQKLAKVYWVQVENEISDQAIRHLSRGVQLKDGLTRAAKVKCISQPDNLWARTPPIRVRQSIPTSWLEIDITEGKNRQIRRMTAAVGFPTLRLIRHRIGDWSLNDLQPGEYQRLDVSF